MNEKSIEQLALNIVYAESDVRKAGKELEKALNALTDERFTVRRSEYYGSLSVFVDAYAPPEKPTFAEMPYGIAKLAVRRMADYDPQYKDKREGFIAEFIILQIQNGTDFKATTEKELQEKHSVWIDEVYSKKHNKTTTT